jgi:hypothetical protein
VVLFDVLEGFDDLLDFTAGVGGVGVRDGGDDVSNLCKPGFKGLI